MTKASESAGGCWGWWSALRRDDATATTGHPFRQDMCRSDQPTPSSAPTPAHPPPSPPTQLRRTALTRPHRTHTGPLCSPAQPDCRHLSPQTPLQAISTRPASSSFYSGPFTPSGPSHRTRPLSAPWRSWGGIWASVVRSHPDAACANRSLPLPWLPGGGTVGSSPSYDGRKAIAN